MPKVESRSSVTAASAPQPNRRRKGTAGLSGGYRQTGPKYQPQQPSAWEEKRKCISPRTKKNL